MPLRHAMKSTPWELLACVEACACDSTPLNERPGKDIRKQSSSITGDKLRLHNVAYMCKRNIFQQTQEKNTSMPTKLEL